jgi:hypothetical protein
MVRAGCRAANRLCASILVGLLLTTGFARAQNGFITQFQLDRDVVEVPFEYIQHEILVTGTAGNRKDLKLLFDSGASAPVLDVALGIRGSHLADTLVQEAEGETRAESVWLDEIRLGAEGAAAKAEGVGVLLADMSHLSRVIGTRIDGIVGITFMAGFVTEIDYQKRLLRFHRPSDYAVTPPVSNDNRRFVFDLTPSSRYKKVSSMMVKGLLHPSYDYSFLFDTGYGGYASISHLEAEQAGMIHTDTPRVSGSAFSVSRSFRTDKIRAPYLHIGDLDLSNKIVSIDYRNSDVIGQPGIIGNQLLQNFHVTLDYPRRKLLLERVAVDEEPDDAVKPSLGLVIRSDSDVIRVAHVKPASPARHAGLRPGDRLIAVDDRSVIGLPVNRVVDLLLAVHGDVRLQLERGADPNLGTGGEIYTRTVTASSPLDWKNDESEEDRDR